MAEITERVDHTGEVVVALDETQVASAVERLVDAGVQAIAVCYVRSMMNPAHELQTGELIADRFPVLEVSLSHLVAPKVGEYPRMLTTVLNAYVAPSMTAYTRAIEAEARSSGYAHDVLFMQSHAGLAPGERIRAVPLSTLQSGPVGGVIGTSEFAKVIERPNDVTTDVGGTILDVSVVVGGKAVVTDEVIIEHHEAFMNVVDVQSIGAGGDRERGASVARVGPVSVRRRGPRLHGGSTDARNDDVRSPPGRDQYVSRHDKRGHPSRVPAQQDAGQLAAAAAEHARLIRAAYPGLHADVRGRPERSAVCELPVRRDRGRVRGLLFLRWDRPRGRLDLDPAADRKRGGVGAGDSVPVPVQARGPARRRARALARRHRARHRVDGLEDRRVVHRLGGVFQSVTQGNGLSGG